VKHGHLTVILGGGFGGIACARALRARMGSEGRIVVVDHGADFLVGATKTWVMLGERRAEDVSRPRPALLGEGVEFLRAEALAVDAGRRRVETDGGAFDADALVVALGADLDMNALPGLAGAAETFYTLEGAARLRGVLDRFTEGRIVILIPRPPFKCPPAPYEAAMLLDAALRRRGARGRVALELWTAEKAPMPTAGAAMGERIIAELEARGIGFHPAQKAVSVDGSRHEVRFEDGGVTAYDLLIAIPPHRVPRVVAEAGLAGPSGWVPVDARTLEVRSPGAGTSVYAIGDVNGLGLPGRYDPSAPLALPKAGVFAAAEGEVVAARIAAHARGEPVTDLFDGRGFCYLEVGQGLAIRADGDFFAMPHPTMSARPATADQYRDKLAWVDEWLAPRS
jgi:sulfide:quinone oxidoreductase